MHYFFKAGSGPTFDVDLHKLCTTEFENQDAKFENYTYSSDRATKVDIFAMSTIPYTKQEYNDALHIQ